MTIFTKGMGAVKQLLTKKTKVSFKGMTDLQKELWSKGYKETLRKKEGLRQAAETRAKTKKAKELHGKSWKKQEQKLREERLAANKKRRMLNRTFRDQ